MHLTLLMKKNKHFLSCLPLMFKDRIEYDNQKIWKRPWEKQNYAMIKIKRNKRTYLIGKIKGVRILNRKRKVLEIIIGDIKVIILKSINNIILLQ